MARLEKVDLGAPGSGVGGDSPRSANDRMNRNADVLNAVVALGYNILSDSWLLVPGNVGTRFGLNMGVPGKVITLPLASSVPLNACIHFFNVGPAVTIALQGKDGTQIPLLNTGDWATYVSDAGSYWHVAERGKMLPDEIVSGFLTVSKGLTVGGSLVAGGDVGASGKLVGFNSSNMLLNGTGELGDTGWTGSNFGWSNGGFGEGRLFLNASAINTGTWVVDASADIPCGAGVPLTVSAEIGTLGLNAGQAYVKCEAFKSDGTYLGNVLTTPPIATKRDATFVKGSGTTPAGTAFVRVSKVADKAPNISQWGVAFRRIKLERGDSPSLYSQEATINYLGGTPTFAGRPYFGKYVPWDSGNLDPSRYAPLSGAEFTNTVSIRSGIGQFRGTATAISGTSTGAMSDGIQFSSVHGPFDREAFFSVREYYNQSTNGLIAVRAGATWRTFLFRTDGNAYCEGNWVNGSDERVKTNVTTIDGALSKMRMIRGCTWDRLDGVSGGIGFIAQDVQKVFPDHVRVAAPARTLADGTTIKDFLSIDTGGIAAALHHQAILELMDEIEGMKIQIKELESKVSA